MQSRALAASIIDGVISNRTSLNVVLEQKLSRLKNTQDKAFVLDLCYGVCRCQIQLDAYLLTLLKKPIKAKDSVIQALLWVGIYQILFQRTPEHAAVSATVDACSDLKKKSAKSFINAILRRFLRERDSIIQTETKDFSIKYSHPQFLLQKIKHDWPEHWQDILVANQQQPPLTLRINQKVISHPEYSKKLTREKIKHSISTEVQSAITLEKTQDVTELPGYKQGEFSVQDRAAQLAAYLLDPKPGNRVLDACAAPGGKTCHILEQDSLLEELVAVEKDDNRIARLKDNLQRLSFKARVINADVSVTESWWDKKLFDRILLDVPCSGSGIIRRHPDIKLIRTEKDIDTVCQTQKNILHNIWPLLRSGGKLVYSTCSIFKQENEQQIEQFIQSHDDATVETIVAEWGMARPYGRQILPGQDNMDGFFYSCLIKS